MLVVKPTKPFSDAEKLKLDQYVMRGGKLIFFVDKLEAELDSLQSKQRAGGGLRPGPGAERSFI